MSPKPQKLPANFWRSRREELTTMAKTMTAEQIAAHFGSTTKRVRNSLSAMQITPAQAFVPLHVGREHQLREMAKTMTFTEMAKAMGTPPNTMYSMLSRLKIKALAKSLTLTLQDRLEELARLATTMDLEQLSKHFDRAPRTIQTEIYKLGMKPITTHQDPWPARADEMRGLAKAMSPAELAKHYDTSRNNMYRILQRFDIQCQQQPAANTAKAAPSKQKPAPTKLTRLESRPPVVPRSTTTRKAPVQIIMPEGLQIRRIEPQFHATPRICNGTSREPYRPHSDVTAVGFGTAYGQMLKMQHASGH